MEELVENVGRLNGVVIVSRKSLHFSAIKNFNYLIEKIKCSVFFSKFCEIIYPSLCFLLIRTIEGNKDSLYGSDLMAN